MPVICWAPLAKSAQDPTTISEYIQARILDHNVDVTSHGLDGYALFNHRDSYPIDHGEECIINNTIRKYARAYKYIVDQGGGADFDNIQDAVDAANADGGGRILLLNDTYILTSAITLYNNISLEGETPSGVIIDITNSSYFVGAQGTTTPYSTGTITINSGSKILTGLGTTFVGNVSVGDYIYFDYRWFEIASVDSNTQLTLALYYVGLDLAGESFKAATMAKDISIFNMTIKANGVNASISYLFCVRCTFDNIHGTGSNKVNASIKSSLDCSLINSDTLEFDFDKLQRCQFQNNYFMSALYNQIFLSRDCFFIDNIFEANANYGIWLSSCIGVVISGNTIRTHNNIGIYVYGCEDCAIDNNYVYGGSVGIALQNSSYCKVYGNSVYSNSSTGISLAGTSVYNQIISNSIQNTGQSGINLGSNTDKNTVANNIINNIGSTGTYPCIYLFSTNNNNIINNTCYNSTRDGIRCYNSDNNNIVGNQCNGNSQYGINITSTSSDKNIVTNNQLLGNTVGALNNSGTSTITANNIII